MQSSDYTLIIPTFNRDDSLSRLLKYLEAQNFPYPIHVLDSSVEEIRETNRELIESVQLECRQVVFSEDTHPFDKFRDGVAEVETELCGLCADDDVILVDGLRESIEFLLANPDYSVAHGYYFQFLYEPKEIFVSTITYYTPSYTNDEPLERLQALMRHYQALTYGTYRSEVLLKVFDNVRPVTSILGRELLSSALAAVYGKVARLPNLFYGRSLGPSASYSCWHPLEWVINDPTDLFSSYKLYRDILLSQTLTSPGNTMEAERGTRSIDMIHLHYFLKHAPMEAFDLIVSETLKGTSGTEIFQSHDVTMGLVYAAAQFESLSDGTDLLAENIVLEENAGAQEPTNPHGMIVSSILRQQGNHPNLVRYARNIKRFATGRKLLSATHCPPAYPEVAAVLPQEPTSVPDREEEIYPLSRPTAIRNYILAKDFVEPPAKYNIQRDDQRSDKLVAAMDFYV